MTPPLDGDVASAAAPSVSSSTSTSGGGGGESRLRKSVLSATSISTKRYTATVAIVDDHETMQALMSMLLTRARVDFVVCSDGGEILARCREGERFRVILLDRHMQVR